MCAFSALTLLVGLQEGHPSQRGYECLGQGADLHIAQLMPLPLTISCCSKSRSFHLPSFTFLVHLQSFLLS